MQPTLTTKRLRLRPLQDADVSAIAHLAGDWAIASMTARIPYPYSEAHARDWMTNLADGEFVRAIERDGQFIGCVGFIPGETRSAEIGYWVARPYWGHGYATEAATALIKYCFTTGGFQRLTCCHFIDNPASARVIEKLGFKPTGFSTTWCDARKADVPTTTYARQRPLIAMFWRSAA